MNANLLVRLKIKKIYNIDGPGLLEKQFLSYKFKRVLPKYEQIIPNESIVGIILNNKNTKVIKSSISGPLAHDIIYWTIKDGRFIPTELSNYSKVLSDAIDNYANQYKPEELKKAISDIYNLLVNCNIIEVNDFKNIKKIKKLIEKSNELDNNSRTILLNLIKMMIDSLGISIKIKFKEILKIL